ncbi:MAG TPA: hypothetical protein DF984_00535 [Anaerolineaceae bacterium]|nr:hypothetical protein [Anaerolineaceae bacterium]
MRKQKRTTSQPLLLPLILIFLFTTGFSPQPVAVPALQTETTDVITAGIAYLGTQINSDGGIRWFDDSSSPAATIRVVQALAAAGVDQDFLQSGSGNAPIDFLETAGVDWVNQQETDSPAFSVARAGQLLTAVAAANRNPQQFGIEEVDLVYPVVASLDPNTGIYGSATPENVTDQVWAMLGLAANAFSVPSEAAIWLAAAQLKDGSWDDGYGSYLDTTPLAVMALIASGDVAVDAPEIQSAVDFLMENQQPDGGWQSQWDTITNANTTAVILQAISSLGQPPVDESWQKADGDPSTALLAIQQENGAIGGDFANAYSTADAIVALSNQALFDLGYLMSAGQSIAYIVSQQAADGGWGSVGQTLDIILALHAAGWDPTTVTFSDNTPLDYLAENCAEYIAYGPDAIGKTILGVTAAGLDPTYFADLDLVAALNATYDETKAAFGMTDNTWHQSLAILGLNAAGESIPSDVVDTLLGLQQEDGGWEYSAGFGTWPDNTALAVQALLAAGETANSAAIQNGLGYLQSMLSATGGWGDSSTTAYSIMALNALGVPNSAWANETGLTPLSELFTYQKTNGAFFYNWEYTDDNLMSTASALLALFGEDFIITAADLDAAYAGLVIDPGEGAATTLCVPLEDESMSGLDLLIASGVTYSAPEGFIESIMDISNPDGGTNYWSYWQWNGNQWVFSNAGAGDTAVRTGSVEAWHFTSWVIFPSLAPDVVPNLSAMCETPVLKNFTEQPFLSFSDLYPDDLSVSIEVESVTTEEPAEGTASPSEPTNEETPAEVTSVEEPEASERSSLPYYLIGGASIIILIVVILILKKKGK